MFNKNVLGIQFLENVIKFTYKEKQKNKWNYYHHQMSNESGLQNTVETMIKELKDNSNLKNFEDVDVYLSLPYNIVKVDTMLPIPAIVGLTGKKLLTALDLYIENSLDISKEDNMYSVLIEQRIDNFKKERMTLVSAKLNEIKEFPKVLYDMNLQLKAIDIESEALKRFCEVKPNTNVAMMSFFTDGPEKYIGMYVYKGDVLVGWRHLPQDVYDHYSLKTEMEVIVNNCRLTFDYFELDEYFIVAEEIEDLRKMKEIFKKEDITYKYHPFHTSTGLMLRSEKQAVKKRRWGRNEN